MWPQSAMYNSPTYMGMFCQTKSHLYCHSYIVVLSAILILATIIESATTKNSGICVVGLGSSSTFKFSDIEKIVA